jgi:hypothetical protein
MRIALHIFMKDARRLRMEIAVTVALLACLAALDRTRMDAVPGAPEAWLNLLLPLAWAFLLAMLFHQEPLVGDRQFWITRPYSRLTLVAAKGLFALAFVHAPSLIADSVILISRGFSPLDSIAPVLWKQALLAAGLTLPVAALAAVTRNLAQFTLAAFIAVAAGIVLASWSASTPVPVGWGFRIDADRGVAAWLLLIPAAVGTIAIQYAFRRTQQARFLSVVGVALAAAVFVYLPPERAFAFSGSSAVSLSFRPETSLPENMRYVYGAARGAQPHAIPIRVTGLEPSSGVRLGLLEFEIRSGSSAVWYAELRPRERRLTQAWVIVREDGTGWLRFTLDRALAEPFKGVKVDVSGRLGAIFYTERQSLRRPAIFASTVAPHIGRCFSMMVPNEHKGREMLKVTCESPASLPVFTRVIMRHPATGVVWNHRLADAMTHYNRPVTTWLSPLNRAQTFFQTTDGPLREGSQWLVPEDAIRDSEISLVAAVQTGKAMLRFELKDLDLGQFAFEPHRR